MGGGVHSRQRTLDKPPDYPNNQIVAGKLQGSFGVGLRMSSAQEGNMKRISLIVFALACALLLAPLPAQAQDKLVISVWGGSWKDMVAEIVGKRFTAQTGVAVEFITGGTIDRLNKAKLAKGNPESDLTFTTSHVGWLYATDGLYEHAGSEPRSPNAKKLGPAGPPRSAPITSAPGPTSTPSATGSDLDQGP